MFIITKKRGLEMKKIVLALLLSISFFTFTGCSSGSDETTSSLREENINLKKENTKLKKQVKASKSLLESLVGTTTTESNSSSSNQMSLNQPGTFQSGEKITVVSIEDNPSIELHETNEGEHAVVVTAEVENTDSSPIDFNAQSFSLYDGDSQMGRFDASTYSNNVPHTIAAQKKATVVMHFAAKGTGPYSVSYGDATWEQ